jgi:hypothetical protein
MMNMPKAIKGIQERNIFSHTHTHGEMRRKDDDRRTNDLIEPLGIKVATLFPICDL